MNKAITQILLQLAQTIFTIGLNAGLVLIYYRIKFKSLRGVWNYAGLRKPEKGAFLRSGATVALAYLFTIAVYIILKLTNGGMSAKLLLDERETQSLPVLIIMILMVGFRSGFGEELLFRGLIANRLFAKMGAHKANLLQALIFTIPHIATFIKSPGLECGLLVANAFVMGLAFGHITHREKGCIVTSIIYHGIINIIAIPITWYLM